LLQEAKESLEQAITSNALDRRKLTYLNDLAELYARQGEIELACSYATQCIMLIDQFGSKNAQQRLFQVHHLLQPYKESSYVQALNEQITPLLSR